MTLGGVRGFYRTTLNALGLKEWTDGFNVDNIPATILDKAYHLDVGHIQVKVGAASGTALDVRYPVTLKVFTKGYRHPAAAIDGALDLAQTILGSFVSANNGLDNVGLKRVTPTGLDTKPFNVKNTYGVILIMTFDSSLVLGF